MLKNGLPTISRAFVSTLVAAFFAIAMTRSEAVATPTLQQTCGGTISYGQTLMIRNHADWPHCDYWFQGAQDDRITINVEVTSGNLKPKIQVYDSEGRILAEGGNAIWGYRLDRGSGRYGFRVTSAGDSRTYGTFRLSIKKVEQTCGGTISYGQTLTVRNHADWPHCDYWFQGTQNDRITINVEVISGNLKPKIQVYDSEGRIFVEGEDRIFGYQLNGRTGWYGLRVTSAGNYRTYGTFRITVSSEASRPKPEPTAMDFVRLEASSVRAECINAWGYQGYVYTYLENRSDRPIDVTIEISGSAYEKPITLTETVSVPPNSCQQMSGYQISGLRIVDAWFIGSRQ